MTKLNTGAVLLLAFIATEAHADGWGGMLKGIKDKLDTKATQDAKKTKQAPTIPDESNAKQTSAPAAESQPKPDAPVISTNFDIKGIQIGMTLKEVHALARKDLASAQGSGCDAAQIPMGHDWYVLGDEVVTCRGYQYFGQVVDNMKAFFIQGKLQSLIIGTFSSETDLNHDLPAVSSALADKYGVKPTLSAGSSRFDDRYNFEVVIKDAAGNELIASGDRRPDLSGVRYKNVSLYMEAKDYPRLQETRVAEKQAAQNQLQQSEQQRKQRDL